MNRNRSYFDRPIQGTGRTAHDYGHSGPIRPMDVLSRDPRGAALGVVFGLGCAVVAVLLMVAF